MRQVTQRLRDGRIDVIDVPSPGLTPDGVLVDVRASLLSAGTERTKIQTGRQSLIGKARSRPDQVRQVLDKAQRDGVRETVRTVRSRLDQPSPLGYSAAGVVLAVGARVRDLVPGDRVACGGADYAVHAEVDHVPANLCVPLPEGVDFDVGAFATVGSIALHGVRQADVSLGEKVAVIGLGLVGQLTGQLLRASGCHVVGVDLSRELLDRAVTLGSADTVFERSALSDPVLPTAAANCDAVIITAATRSNDPVELAAALARDRGRVVMVGVTGMEIPRGPYYDKELELRLSRSYGPGRYDREYEERGLDYPIGYVRWTERRNMVAFLTLAATERLNLADLITGRVPVERAADAYDQLVENSSSPLAMVIQYEQTELPPEPAASLRTSCEDRHTGAPRPVSETPEVGLVGAGSFAQATIIPGMRKAGFRLACVASATGRTAHAAKQKSGFERLASSGEIIADPSLDVVAIATRHATHAELAVAALRAGKAVFVEKPPAVSEEQIEDLRAAQDASGRPLLVGFNRRHAPMAQAMRDHVRAEARPFELLLRVNAGRLGDGHWLNDLEDGGGRLIGEGCHFVDFACWFAGRLPMRVSCVMRAGREQPIAIAQSFAITLDFGDGSLASISYGAQGANGLSKELFEAHSEGRSAVLDDFTSLATYNGRKRQRTTARRRDKGHDAQFAHLLELVTGRVKPVGPSPLQTMVTVFAALRSAETGEAVSL